MDQCLRCGKKKIIAIEYSWDSPEHYDGISEYMCLECGYRQGRWTGKVLSEGDIESRYGEKGVIHE